jgi:uncharacterized repeat protein (TIGR02543 family)
MKRQAVLLAVLVFAILRPAFGQVELIQNGGFESAVLAPWVLTTGVKIGTTGAFDGSQFLELGNAAGSVQQAYQIVTFPTNTIAATLSVEYEVLTSDTAGSDLFYVYLGETNQPTSDWLLLGHVSNQNATSWVPSSDTFSTYAGQGQLSPYAGKTVELLFYAQTDPTYGSLTSFNVDDVSLQAATTANIPSNDNFSNATPIFTVGVTNIVNTTYASKEVGEPNHGGNAGGHSVWWNWTAPAIGTVTIATFGSSFNTLLGVYTGGSVSNLTLVTNNNGINRPTGLASVKFVATPGTTYQVALDGYNGQSGNAEFAFSFVEDVTPPKVTITTPAAGAIVGGSSIVVSGTASDNVAVQTVQFRLTNSLGTNNWQTVSTTNNFLNWTVALTNLIPGPNTFQAQAFDTSSNASAVLSRVFNYEISVPIALATNGHGTVTGATNGQLLHLGFPYKIIAKAAAGFAFTGWTGSVSNHSATLSFVMESNLNFTANFVDAQKPILSVTAPATRANVSNSVLQITGKASDNVGVANVYYQLNGGSWNNPQTTNAWTNWSAEVNLVQSNNTLRAWAEDAAGNLSATTTVVFAWVPSARLGLAVNGAGTLSPNYSNALLQIGKTFTIAAVPKSGSIFSNWVDSTGNEITNGPSLKFVMASNLFFIANFVPNPYTAAAGSYQGLFYNSNVLSPTDSGAFSAQVAGNGSFTVKLQQGNLTHSVSGQFSAGGLWSTNSIKTWNNTTISLKLDLTGADALTGTLSNASWQAQIQSSRDVFSKTNPAPEAGNYTIVFPASQAPGVPAGNGYGALSVSEAGTVTFTGVLGDGTKVSESSALSAAGQWPVYLPLAGGNGMVIGWLTFANAASSDLSGPLQWFEPAGASSPLFTQGFTNQINAVGSRYSVVKNQPILDLTAGYVLLENGGLPQSVSNRFTLAVNNKVTGTGKLTLAFAAATGLFQGSATNSSGKTILFNGALLQKQTNGFGLFLNGSQTGGVLLAPDSN